MILFEQPNVTGSQSKKVGTHLLRMGERRTAKQMRVTVMYSTRKKGRPRKKWYDETLKDLTENVIQNWKEKAKDRKKWKDTVRLWT